MKLFGNVPRINEVNDLLLFLGDKLRVISAQVNGLTEGTLSVRHGAITAAPTIGRHSVGDETYNSNVVELGTAGSKYIITGWTCVVAGEPGTWVQRRCLTGN